MDNGTLTFSSPDTAGHVLVFRRALLPTRETYKWPRAGGSKLVEQRLWFATIAPLRNAAGLYDPGEGYLVNFGNFEDSVHRDTLEQAKLHVLAIHALTG